MEEHKLTVLHANFVVPPEPPQPAPNKVVLDPRLFLALAFYALAFAGLSCSRTPRCPVSSSAVSDFFSPWGASSPVGLVRVIVLAIL